MTGIPKSDYTEAQLLNANALTGQDVAAVRAMLEECMDRQYPLITGERLAQSLTRMDVAVVRAANNLESPIVAMGTISRVAALGRTHGLIRDVVVGHGHIHHRANLVSSVLGRLLARAQEFVFETVEIPPAVAGLMADEILAAYGYRRSETVRIILNELR